MVEAKICTRCEEEYPATTEYFYKRGQGLRADCKSCCNERKKQWYQGNRDKISKYNKQWYQGNRDKISKYNKQYHKQYYQENQEKMSERVKRWCQRNKEKMSEYRKQYYRQYYEDNKEYYIRSAKKRDAVKRGLCCDFTGADWQFALDYFDGSCAYCGIKAEFTERRTLDEEHVIPLSLGGPYTASNIVPACQPCNDSKAVRSLGDWYPKQDFYSKERYDKILDYVAKKEINYAN